MSKKRILLIGKKGMRNPFPKCQFDVKRVLSPESALCGEGFDLVIADWNHYFRPGFSENIMPRVNRGGSVVLGSIATDQQGAINLLSEALSVSRELCEALRQKVDDLQKQLGSAAGRRNRENLLHNDR